MQSLGNFISIGYRAVIISGNLLQRSAILCILPRPQSRNTLSSLLHRKYFSVMSSERKPFERLPANVVPRNYNLSLQPDLKEFVFKGNEVVSVEVD